MLVQFTGGEVVVVLGRQLRKVWGVGQPQGTAR